MMPVIVLGSGYSGSSAILDYIRGRDDVIDPLKGQEFRLIQEKDGLSDLHRALALEYHPDNAMYAILGFLELAERLGADTKRYRLPPKLGYGYENRIPGYKDLIHEFIDDITACWIGKYPLRDKLNYNTLDWIFHQFRGFPRTKRLKPIPIQSTEFMTKAQRLINKLFILNTEFIKYGLPHAVFDQAGSFWCPSSSTQYFGENRRVIIVTRNPCDVYADVKHKFWGNAQDFAKYHVAVMDNVNRSEWADRRVMKVQFERFVTNPEEEIPRLCYFLGMDSNIASDFSPGQSEANVGISKKKLTPEEIAIIDRLTEPALDLL